MIHLGLSAAEHRVFHRALAHTHQAATTVTVLDRDEQVIMDVPLRVTTGAVHIDTTQPVNRSLELELAESDQRFHFIPDGAGDFSLFADNYLRVTRSVFVTELDRWVHVPVFTGPITNVAHDQSAVQVTAVGKESLALAPAVAWQPQTEPKGKKVTEAIHDVMAAQGERKFDLPELALRLRHPVTLGRSSEPWKVARKLANSVDRQLFYDGRGKLRLRAHPGPHHSFTFSTGDDGTVLTAPSIKFDSTAMRNTVEALGPKPDGPQKRLRWVAYPPKSHPLSPWKLARNGEPRFLVETVEMDHAQRLEQVRKRAERELDDLLRVAIEVSFDALPAPHLEPGDVVRLNVDGEMTHFRIKQMSIPLIGSDPQSMGYLRRVSRRKGKKKHG